MGNNRNTCINAKHFDKKKRETLQKIRHDIEVLTIKIILKDDPCFVETAK